MNKKIIIIIVAFIALVLFLYNPLFGQAYKDDTIPLKDFIFEDISNYSGVLQKYNYINRSTFIVNQIYF
jgi:hypothetical protein